MAESIVQINWAYSNKRQASYDIPNPDADVDQSHPFEGNDVVDHAPNMSDNSALMGKGHEFATRNDLLSWDTKFKRSFRATSKILAHSFAFHCGKVTTSSLGGGAFSHVIEWMDLVGGAGYYGFVRQLPVFTIVEQVTSQLIRQFPSNVVKSIEITGKTNDFVKAAVEYQGSGKKNVLGSFTFPDTNLLSAGGEGDVFRNASLLFEYGPTGTYADESCDVRSWRFRSENALFEDEGYCPGSGYQVSGDPTSGQVRNTLQIDKRAVMVEFVARAGNNVALINQMTSATLMSLRMTLVGSLISGGIHHSITIDMPKISWKAVPIGTDGDMVTYNVAAIVFYDTAMANPYTVTVVNDVPTYLVSS